MIYTRQSKSPRVPWTIVAVGFCALLVIIAILWLLSSFNGFEKETKVPFIGGFFAVLVVVLTYVRENSLKRQEAHRIKKIEIYSTFYDMMFEIIKNNKNPEKQEKYLKSSELIDTMFALKKGIMFYGSPAVVNAFNEFQGNAQDSSALKMVEKIGNVIIAMRRDIGLSNFGLDGADILQTIITDNVREKLADRKVEP
ncbi:MAG: hypothetical protein LCH46_02610 [Proteobacteria bacterium]|nr:hypothetical protein [Pseudomonadota bacterium]